MMSYDNGRTVDSARNDNIGYLEPDAQSIRAQSERIRTSRAFTNSDRLKRFLEFTVEQTISGRSAGLKEYTIATEVFDRAASFDPKVHSIVRVEAIKLRTKLKEYYAGDGKTDAVLIELPKGSYVPVFELRRSPILESSRGALENPTDTPHQYLYPCLIGLALLGAGFAIGRRTAREVRAVKPSSLASGVRRL